MSAATRGGAAPRSASDWVVGRSLPNQSASPAAAAAPPTNDVTWTLGLQDKAWRGYTLVITYDYEFDPRKTALDLRGAHPEGVERETGSVAITTAASLELKAKSEEALPDSDAAQFTFSAI